MFGLKERPYSGRELKSFWCDSDNKNFDFLRFSILADISVLLILAIIKIWEYSPYNPTRIISKYLQYAYWP